MCRVTTRDSKKVQKKRKKELFWCFAYILPYFTSVVLMQEQDVWEEKVGFLNVGPNETLVT